MTSVERQVTRPQERFGIVVLLLFGAAVVFAYAPMQVAVFKQLWAQPHTQFFPFVVAAVIALVATRWNADKTPAGTPVPWTVPWYVIVLAVVAWLALAAAVAMYAPWVASASLILFLGAVTAAIARWRHVTYLWGIWALLWLVQPLPLNMDQRLIVRLQRLSSSWSSSLLDALGVRHLMEGNTLTLASGGKQLFVDEACSGIVSVMSIVACGAIYGVWRNRPPLHIILLAAMSVFWAFVTNVLRISTIALALEWWGLDWSEGYQHEVISLVVFCFAFGALIATDLLLEGLLTPIGARYAEQVNKPLAYGERLVGWADWLLIWGDPLRRKPAPAAPELVRSSRPRRAAAWAAVVAFGALGALQLVWLPSPDTEAAAAAIDRALAIQEGDMPDQIGPWRRVSFETVEREAFSDFGRYSKSFRYRHDGAGEEVEISLDFPYRGGWHDLCVCYRNTGWTIDQRVVNSTTLQGAWPFVDGRLTSPTRGFARVVFAGFDVSGQPADPPSDIVLFRPWFKLRREMLMNLAPQLFQVQIFQVRRPGDKAAGGEALEDLLRAACEEFRDLVAAPASQDAAAP